MNDGEGCYSTGYVITFVIIFIGSWIYAIATYGFFLGVGLGWFPALVIAGLASLFWPLIWLAIAALVVLLLS